MVKEYFYVRCAEIGIHHHIAGPYLLRYAQESSYGTFRLTGQILGQTRNPILVHGAHSDERVARLTGWERFLRLVRHATQHAVQARCPAFPFAFVSMSLRLRR